MCSLKKLKDKHFNTSEKTNINILPADTHKSCSCCLAIGRVTIIPVYYLA